MNNLLKFARWVDEFEQRNPERKFASVEEALEFYRAVEGELSPAERFVASLPGNSNAINADEGNHELSLEILSRAMKEEGGEYFYLAYAPGPDGSNLMDMAVKNGRRLVEVLASYSLDQNAGDKVIQFTSLVTRIFMVAGAHIAKETARRARNN